METTQQLRKNKLVMDMTTWMDLKDSSVNPLMSQLVYTPPRKENCVKENRFKVARVLDAGEKEGRHDHI